MLVLLAIFSITLLQLVFGTPLEKRGISGPVIKANFQDPSFVFAGAGTSTVAFSSNNGGRNVPVATKGANFNTWTLTSKDALPTVGEWSTGNNVVSPDAIQRVRLLLCRRSLQITNV